jgi:hypothetical protein
MNVSPLQLYDYSDSSKRLPGSPTNRATSFPPSGISNVVSNAEVT